MTSNLSVGRGTQDHQGLWAVYYVVNYLGALLCLLEFYAIYWRYNKQSIKAHDIFVSGLLFNCITMSVPCATQCLLNAISDESRFAWGEVACFIEAFAHVSSIIGQFRFNLYVALTVYVKVVWHPRQISIRQAKIITACEILLSWIGTYVSGLFSEIYLMPAGAYCFYNMTSPAIEFWFVPMNLLTLLLDAYFYGHVVWCFWHARINLASTVYKVDSALQHSAAVPLSNASPALPDRPLPLSAPRTGLSSSAVNDMPATNDIKESAIESARLSVPIAKAWEEQAESQNSDIGSARAIPSTKHSPSNARSAAGGATSTKQPRDWYRDVKKAACRGITIQLIFFLGWGPAVTMFIYQRTTGHESEALDTYLAVSGSFHSLVLPIWFLAMNPELRFHVFRLRPVSCFVDCFLRCFPTTSS